MMASQNSQHDQPEQRPRWDSLVPLTHWGIAGAVLVNAAITEEGSQIHVWVGYGVLGLLILRIVWGAIGTESARFSSFPPSLAAARGHLADMIGGRHRPYRSHNPLGSLMAYALWATLAVVVATGIGMAGSPLAPRAEGIMLLEQVSSEQSGLYAEDEDEDEDEDEHEQEGGMVAEALEEVHEVAVTILLILAGLHVGGVLVDSRLSGRNLVRPMVKGS